MAFKIGIGYDLHKLVEGRKLFLGGVRIPSSKGLLAHSDGDVLLHAICDALLGACGLGDIGNHFPDTSDEFKDIAGLELLKRTYAIIMKDKKCKILNIDTILVCDQPKIAGHAEGMKKAISDLLGIGPGNINIKAKTTEKTAVDVISAYATVLVDTD